jgi:hypothetical protein
MAANTAQSAGGSRAIITAAETNQLVVGSGTLERVIINNVGTTMTVDVYDNASTNANKIFEWLTVDGKGVRELMLPFSAGLRVVVGGTAGNVVLVWK